MFVALDVLGAAKGGELSYVCSQGVFGLAAFIVEATAADDASFLEKSVGDAKGRASRGTAIKVLVVRFEAECKVAGLKSLSLAGCRRGMSAILREHRCGSVCVCSRYGISWSGRWSSGHK